MRKALITGVAGTRLSPDEARFLARVRPAGVILFARNCATRDQISRLTADVHAAVDSDDLLVLIDQEGGRVRRLRPPEWRELPPARAYASVYVDGPARACRLAGLVASLTAADLREIGINTNCAPVLDVPAAGSHAIIGDRAYGDDPDQVAALGRAVAEGYAAGGVLPVIKHIPGHGRATADSHEELPVVTISRAELERVDLKPFRALADQPAAMTAHVVFTDVDPVRPASTSACVIDEIVRGSIGFNGLLMSDDLGMKALTGDMRTRAEAVIAAGTDIALHCSGDLAEMEAAAAGVPVLAGAALARFNRCLEVVRRTAVLDRPAAELALAEVTAAAGADHSAPRVESV